MARRFAFVSTIGVLLCIVMLASRQQVGRAATALAAPDAFPHLTAGTLIEVDSGQPATLPLSLANGGLAIDTIFFAMAYDATLLTFDPTDSGGDGTPDDMDFTLPAGYVALVEAEEIDNEGRIQVLIYNQNSVTQRITPGKILDITFTAAHLGSPTLADVIFLQNPKPFFVQNNGTVYDGEFHDGSFLIHEGEPTPTATPTTTGTPTAKPTSTATPTVTSTPTNTATPTVTGTPTNTATPTATATPTVTGTPPTATPTETATPTTTATSSPTPTVSPTATFAGARFFLPALHFEAQPTPTPTPSATTPSATTPSATPTQPATATATSQPTATATSVPGQCVNLARNGGFESDSDWQLNQTVYPAGFVTFPTFSGGRSLRAGIVHPPDNVFSYSSAQQLLFIPAGPPSVKLSFRLFATTTGRAAERLVPPPVVPTSPLDRAQLADDAQMVLLFDRSGRQHVLLFQRQWYGDWRLHEIDLTRFRGQSVTLYFGVFNNGTGGVTGMYMDEVAVSYCLP